VSVTRFSNDAALYVNLTDAPKTRDEITIPSMDFVRVG